jgi:hypothetical protein
MKRRLLRPIAVTSCLGLSLGLVALLGVPAGAQPVPILQVTPSTGLENGVVVSVTASGLADGHYSIYECVREFETPRFPSTCNPPLAQVSVVNGTATTSVRVVEDVGVPEGSSEGTVYDTCQTVYSTCELSIGSNIHVDENGQLTGFVADATLNFVPALTRLGQTSTPLVEGQFLLVLVRLPDPVRGEVRVWECTNQFSQGAGCEDATVFPGFTRSTGRGSNPTLVLVRVTQLVNGARCHNDGPFGTGICTLTAGLDLGAPNGNIIGIQLIDVLARGS